MSLGKRRKKEVLEGGSLQINLCLPCLLPGIDRLTDPARTGEEGSGKETGLKELPPLDSSKPGKAELNSFFTEGNN